MIELPDFLTPQRVEAIYGRALRLAKLGHQHQGARRLLDNGLRRARARDARLLLVLEKGADYLQSRNDEQRSRFEQEGYARQEFGEYALWREAYQKVLDPKASDMVMTSVYGWILAAIGEFLDRG
jgi:hypothetical protein